MNALALAIACLVPTAGAADEYDNPLLRELLSDGVTIGGTAIQLPPPTLTDKLDADEQRAALDKITDANHTLDKLLGRSVNAPFVLKRSAEATKDAEQTAQRVDLWFFVHAELEEVASQDFVRRWSDLAGGKESSDDLPVRSGELSPQEIAERKLKAEADSGEHYLYSTINLLDRVRVSATRRAVVSRSDGSLLVAARVDSRFDDDPEYPNQWQPLVRNEAGKLSAQEPRPYPGAAFYVKVTKLAEPAGTLLIEHHQVFTEPQGWFRGAKLL
ncbi:MAG TPA: hypothetical protein VGX78_03770, partial [Pirellulales bacterium]|nr:hypothetical protein [Pirellulales bacterium]